MAELVSHSLVRMPPAAGTKLACTTTSSGAQNLSSFVGKRVAFQMRNAASSATCIHVVFGASGVGAADVSDYSINVYETLEVMIVSGSEYFRARTDVGTADLIYAAV